MICNANVVPRNQDDFCDKNFMLYTLRHNSKLFRCLKNGVL
jgi:hypothetical protein